MVNIPMLSDFKYGTSQVPTANDYFNNSTAQIIANNGVPIPVQRLSVPDARFPISSAILNGTSIPDPDSLLNQSTSQQQAATTNAAAAAAAAKEQQANPLRQALAGLDTTLSNRLSQNQGEYDKVLQQYNEMDAQDAAAHAKQVGDNEAALTGQRQSQMLQGARLGNNLQSVLASMGALNGTGGFLANQAVQGIVNSGLGGAKEAFDTNAGNINTAYEQAEREQRQRRDDASTLLANKNSNTRADVMTNRQNILNQLGNLFGAGTAKGADYLGQAGALYGDIANTTRPNVGSYQKSSSLYSPSALQSYLDGIGNTSIQSQSGAASQTPINSPLFAQNDKRRQEQLG